MRWQGHASAADSWEPAEHLANCPERVAEYEAAAPRRPKALRAHQRAGPAPLAQAAAAGPPPDLGSAILYWWPDEGWQLGRVR